MGSITDISDTEQWTVRNSLDERWGKDKVDLHIVDVDARLDPSDRELTECPALYWEQGESYFVILKTGHHRYRTQFHYGNREQFGSGITEYEELGECVLSLLRLQADHERSRTEEKDSD